MLDRAFIERACFRCLDDVQPGDAVGVHAKAGGAAPATVADAAFCQAKPVYGTEVSRRHSRYLPHARLSSYGARGKDTLVNEKLTARANHYDQPARLMEAGIYPYYRSISASHGPTVEHDGQQILMFGSNSYLGLSDRAEVKDAAARAIARYGTGCGGSRLLNGTIDLHEQLEARLAAFVGKPAAAVFASGYQTNVGVLSALLGRHDVLLHDEHNHASLLDGGRLSFARSSKFAHNDPVALEAALAQSHPSDPQALQLVAVDTVFSMEGDVAPLTAIAAACQRHGAALLVDEAHGLGVLGENGRGSAVGCGVDAELVMGTFSKSLASVGGFIAASEDLVRFIKHRARSLVFSASLSPANAASALAALDVMEREPGLVLKLRANASYARAALAQRGLVAQADDGYAIPIIPIPVADEAFALRMATELIGRGVFVNAIIPPAVPRGTAMLRFSVMATHSHGQIDAAVETIALVKAEIDAALAAA